MDPSPAITVVPCLSDNYAYLLDVGGGDLAVVDAPEAAPIAEAVARHGGRLTAVLATHHHHDHVDGNEELARRFPGLRIFGHQSDRGRIPGQTEFLSDGDTFRVGRLSVGVRHIPGHTLGAVAYIVGDAVFTGDTLFAAGCGRLFEGTPAMMHRSLCEVLAPLGEARRVYPGHEYTVSNLHFARAMEPGNRDVEERLARSNDLRRRGEPTIGGTLGDEMATNPFLRCSSGEIRGHLGVSASASDVAVFGALRKAKDTFRAPT